ncbi:transposase [Actinacidiphila glaucinigra]|uniref:transposase n=1 Tax=Actinacidiphila glaucinigra TaxID=235986 RepID=UPI003D922E32
MPGIGTITGARVLAEFGDDSTRYTSAKARKNYAGTSPITRASGRTHAVYARHARNDRLADALHRQAFSAINTSPGARPLLRQTARTRRWLQPRPAPARQPPRRHPPWMPQDPHPLRRDHRVVTPRSPCHSCLTSLRHGMSDQRLRRHPSGPVTPPRSSARQGASQCRCQAVEVMGDTAW